MDRIRLGVSEALSGDLSRCRVQLPEHFQVEARFKDHFRAYRASFYPGASLKDANTIRFETGAYFEVMRLLSFII